MASPTVTVRVPSALLALIDAECDRTGRDRSGVILGAVESQLGDRAQDAPAPRSPPRRAAAQEAAAQATAKTGVEVTAGISRARAAMDAAGTVEWDPNAKRTPYQKGSAGAGKGRGR